MDFYLFFTNIFLPVLVYDPEQLPLYFSVWSIRYATEEKNLRKILVGVSSFLQVVTNKVKTSSCLVFRESPFVKGRSQFGKMCILANLIVDLSQTETAKWAPSSHFLLRKLRGSNLQIFVANRYSLWTSQFITTTSNPYHKSRGPSLF